MAKLSAHGKEICRIIITDEAPERLGERIVRREDHVSFRTDGHMLRKRVLTWVSDGKVLSGERYSYGWKLWRRHRARKNVTADQMREYARKLVRRCEEQGATVETTGL